MSGTIRLQLHPGGAKSFDEKAETLLTLVADVSPQTGKSGFQPQIHPRSYITQNKIIGDVEIGFLDFRGQQVGKTFVVGGSSVGLVGLGYKEIVSLASRLQQTSSFRPYISLPCLIDETFRWVKKRYLGQSSDAYSKHVLHECEQKISKAEMWVPLFNVFIETEFPVGNIKFKTLTQEMLVKYHRKILEKVPEEKKIAFQAELARERSRFQGCAAATIEVIAEPLRAAEIAEEEADYAIASFRSFHPANQTPFFRCFCTVNGMENLGVSSVLTINDGAIQNWTKSSNVSTSSSWVLSNSEIELLRSNGLDSLSSLLAHKSRTPFQGALMDALLVYSRNSLFDDPVNRIVHILAAVESILLRDNNEPIQKNIGERLAFLVGGTVEERIAVRDNVTRVYGLRSGFLHHGRAWEDMDALEGFMRYVWVGFTTLIYDMDKYQSKEDLVTSLERRKME